MKILRNLFGCAHKRTTFPQGKADRCHVTCLSCGKEFDYSWKEMRTGREIPRLADVAANLAEAEA